MAIVKAPNYTKEQERILAKAFQHHTTMDDELKRKLVDEHAELFSKKKQSIVSKLSTMQLWTPYLPKAASSVKRAPTRAQYVHTIQTQLKLDKATLTSFERALSGDLVTLIQAIDRYRLPAKIEAETES